MDNTKMMGWAVLPENFSYQNRRWAGFSSWIVCQTLMQIVNKESFAWIIQFEEGLFLEVPLTGVGPAGSWELSCGLTYSSVE